MSCALNTQVLPFVAICRLHAVGDRASACKCWNALLIARMDSRLPAHTCENDLI
jgi:hypothetical protein